MPSPKTRPLLGLAAALTLLLGACGVDGNAGESSSETVVTQPSGEGDPTTTEDEAETPTTADAEDPVTTTSESEPTDTTRPSGDGGGGSATEIFDDPQYRDLVVGQFTAMGMTETQANCVLDAMVDSGAMDDPTALEQDPMAAMSFFTDCGVDLFSLGAGMGN